jgi:cell division septation protein DedD
MGDDFDLFPKRENLDPFSFGTKDKEKSEVEDEEVVGEKDPVDFLFNQDEAPPTPADPPVPTLEEPGEQKLPPDELMAPSGEPEPEVTIDAFADMSEKDSDEIFGEAPSVEREPEPAIEGPIPDDQSGYGPRKAGGGGSGDDGPEAGKRRPSPFIVIGGALVLILALLWGALTYIQKERKVVVPASIPPASAKIGVPKAQVKPAPTPAPAQEVQTSAPASVSKETSEKPPAEIPAVAPVPKPEEKSVSASLETRLPDTVPSKTSVQTTDPKTKADNYSVQVGAFILKTSVRALEKELASVGIETFLKEGSTQAMMHYLTVEPFDDPASAANAVSDLRRAGIDSNLQKVSGGGAVIHAGSFLLEENARKVMKRIRSLGYPVRLTKKETQLPMTFVRVGKFPSKSEATKSRNELKSKGFDAIVVKLQ